MPAAGSTLGDLLRGLAGLSAGDERTAARIAAMLSVSGEAPDRPAGRAEAARSGPEEPVLPTEPGAPADGAKAPLHGAEPAPHWLHLRRVVRSASPPGWLDGIEAMPPADPEARRADVPPLLDPSRQRALLIELAATRRPADDIDLDALTEQMARGLTLARIPFRRRPTLQQGLIVLLDHRLGMAPYRADQLGMVRLARSLIPDERVRVGRFEGVPGRRALFDNVLWQSRAGPPSDATPVLVLSDLSVGGPTHDEARAAGFEWEVFLCLARGARRALRVLVPRAPDGWPLACRGEPALLEWSRALTLGDIRRRARPA